MSERGSEPIEQQPRVVVSVVSGARRELILDFLRSLHATTPTDPVDLRVVAIVNEPDEALRGEIDASARAWGSEQVVDVRVNRTARGFAANHNSVMRQLEADYYLIANDDVVVVDDAVGRLVRYMESPENARVAVVSPLLRNADGTVQPSTMSFPTVPRTLLSISGLRRNPAVALLLRAAGTLPRFGGGRSKYWAHDRTTVVDTLSGAFVLVRARAVTQVGYMDEASLVGGEEAEWHKRMADAGWSVVFCTDAQVVHIGKQTVGRDPALDLEYARGWLNYFAKHAPVRKQRVLAASALTVWAIRWLGGVVRRDATARARALGGMELSRKAWAGRLVRSSDHPQESA